MHLHLAIVLGVIVDYTKYLAPRYIKQQQQQQQRCGKAPKLLKMKIMNLSSFAPLAIQLW